MVGRDSCVMDSKRLLNGGGFLFELCRLSRWVLLLGRFMSHHCSLTFCSTGDMVGGICFRYRHVVWGLLMVINYRIFDIIQV